uniref:F-box and WD repeat domain containing 4 n=1 Tax=Oryzias melastigma TaxID=30732 RepID=A0A3B3CXR1_ORYME
MLLFQLPEEVLHNIFSYLDCKSLGRLCQVCKGINDFVNTDAVWRKMGKDMLNTGITWNGTDLYPHIPLKERVKTAQNWATGVCKKFIPLKWKTKLLPWLQLDGDVLFLSQATDVGLYRLHRHSRRLQQTAFKIYSGHKGDVCCFVLTDSHLISGGSDGTILVHSRRSDLSTFLLGHSQEVNCLDVKDGVTVSGSRDRTVRVRTNVSLSVRNNFF